MSVERPNEEALRGLPDHELTMIYDISLKLSNDHHEPDRQRVQVADEQNRLAKAEMKRRGLFDGHRPR